MWREIFLSRMLYILPCEKNYLSFCDTDSWNSIFMPEGGGEGGVAEGYAPKVGGLVIIGRSEVFHLDKFSHSFIFCATC